MPVIARAIGRNGRIGIPILRKAFDNCLSALRLKNGEWDSLAPLAYLLSAKGSISARGARSHQLDTDELFTKEHRFIIQVASVASASCSVIVAAVVLFWFVRMKKRFRHKLIMLLVTGDLIRAMWYMIFACVTFGEGKIESARAICQASGFLIQLGTEMTDFSVLFISIHGAVQVFNPAVSSHGSDFFHKNRHYVYATIILVPLILSCLPFSNPYEPGYLSQGAFCSLPIRPIWFRLALAWIPRYIIWVVIFVLAIAIYIHVRIEFRAVEASQRPTSEEISTVSEESADQPPPDQNQDKEQPNERPTSLPPSPMDRTSGPDSSFFAPLTLTISEDMPRNLAPANAGNGIFVSPQFNNDAHGRGPQVRINVPAETNPLSREPPTPTSNRKSTPSFTTSFSSWRTGSFPLLSSHAEKDRRMSVPSMYSNASGQSCHTVQRNSVATTVDGRRRSDAPERRMAAKRRRIQRQLRAVFIYPIVYVLMWLVPFVVLCFQYSDYWAQHPPWVLTTISNVCLCSMGAVNGIVFALREKPWLHIPGCEKSFWASFAFWRALSLFPGRRASSVGAGPAMAQRDAEDANAGASQSASVSTSDPAGAAAAAAATAAAAAAASAHRREAPAQRASWRARGSDTERAAREQAYERLAKEKADRIAAHRQSGHVDGSGTSHDGRRSSVASYEYGRQLWDRRDLALMGSQGRRGSAWTRGSSVSISEGEEEGDEDEERPQGGGGSG
ncbi:hypothetical protein K490DRAFT_69527 [Saccharata proteae CBS 121410]|uniref:Family A G protein-coupled receptor-like protein n=1 Tax=Saccharata proteae CBS 121410 TaxID=1314787 RepID=A0A9P4HQX9_9PEZI|nr:hypothetical protein K490DRAFT_69527 [Saccharata proteae CBS 121410]